MAFFSSNSSVCFKNGNEITAAPGSVTQFSLMQSVVIVNLCSWNIFLWHFCLFRIPRWIKLFPMKLESIYFVTWPQLFKGWATLSTGCRISLRWKAHYVLATFIRWIAIYSLDSVIRSRNNQVLMFIYLYFLSRRGSFPI